MQPYVDHWDQAMALLAHPINIGNSTMRLFSFANDLLFLAKDESAGVRRQCDNA